MKNAIIGYDFGFFVQDRYILIGNTKKHEDAIRLLHEWASERNREVTIIQEQEPSRSKNLKSRLHTNEYRCSLCKQVYIKEVSDEEAMAETNIYWPDVTQVECGIVCDDCWQKIKP